MARLNQIIAVEKGVKSRSFQELTEAHHVLQKPTMLSGISRTYRPMIGGPGRNCTGIQRFSTPNG